jgi:hypothetical protein
MPAWGVAQAQKVGPYLNSILRSLREHWIAARSAQAQMKRLTDRPGRPDRRILIAQAEAGRESQGALDRFREAWDELEGLGVFCEDPVTGVALIPCFEDGKVAWLIHDLFDEQPLRYWRFDTDAPETRRPIGDLAETDAPHLQTA